MSNFTKKFARHRPGELRAEEKHLYSIVGQPEGSWSGALNKAGGWAGLRLLSDHDVPGDRPLGPEVERPAEALGDLTSREDDSSMAGQVALKNSYVTLTSERVLFHPTTFLGKPKDRSAEFPLELVSSMASNQRSELEIRFSDGSELGFNLLSHQNPARLVELFDELQSAR